MVRLHTHAGHPPSFQVKSRENVNSTRVNIQNPKPSVVQNSKYSVIQNPKHSVVQNPKHSVVQNPMHSVVQKVHGGTDCSPFWLPKHLERVVSDLK